MKITRITFTNFMGYNSLNIPSNLEEEFPNGLILISGKNSYGKSTILEGILFAFFGPGIFPGRNQASFITYGEKKAEIYIYFELDDINYYLYRKWSRSGSSSSKLFKYDKNYRKYLEEKKINIERFFEISRDQAMNTVFVRQGEVEELANIKGAKLRDMIIDLFRLNIIDDSLKFLDDEMKNLNLDKSKLENLKVPIDRIEKDINSYQSQVKEFKDIIVKKKEIKQKIEEKLKSYPSEKLISKLESLFRIIEIAEGKYQSHHKVFESKIKTVDLQTEDFSSRNVLNSKINSLNKSRTNLETTVNELDRKRQVTTKGMGMTKGRIEDIEGKLKKMGRSRKELDKGNGTKIVRCPTCQSELTQEHYESVIKDFTKDIKNNQEKLSGIEKLVNDIKKNIEEQQNKLDKIKNELNIIQGLREDFENFQNYKSELLEYKKESEFIITKNKNNLKDVSPEGIRQFSDEIIKNKQKVEALNNDISEKQEMIKKNEKLIDELREEIDKMKQLDDQIGIIEVDLEHLNKAKEFVRRFVTEYMVAKRLVKNIALKAEKYITDFTSGQYGELLLEESGSKKTGLILKVKDHFNGQHESVEFLSGGDRTALGMALRLAISELMNILRPTKNSPKKNPKIDFLLLDEPLAALDETRRERILIHLTRSTTFSQIFLITHTAIPTDIRMHKIMVDKDHSTGISTAKFEKVELTPLI